MNADEIIHYWPDDLEPQAACGIKIRYLPDTFGTDVLADVTCPACKPVTVPDPNITGPCQLQASPFCENVGIQRLDPMAMLTPETAFAVYLSACLPCYEARADRYVTEVHAGCIGYGTGPHVDPDSGRHGPQA